MYLLEKLTEIIQLVKYAKSQGLDIFISDTLLEVRRGGFDPRTETVNINPKIHKALKETFGI